MKGARYVGAAVAGVVIAVTSVVLLPLTATVVLAAAGIGAARTYLPALRRSRRRAVEERWYLDRFAAIASAEHGLHAVDARLSDLYLLPDLPAAGRREET